MWVLKIGPAQCESPHFKQALDIKVKGEISKENLDLLEKKRVKAREEAPTSSPLPLILCNHCSLK